MSDCVDSYWKICKNFNVKKYMTGSDIIGILFNKYKSCLVQMKQSRDEMGKSENELSQVKWNA
jgi:hypothetical protein